jgi:hypothetical protein
MFGLRALQTGPETLDKVLHPRLSHDGGVQPEDVMNLELACKTVPAERRISDNP